MTDKKLFVFGLGFSATRTAVALAQRGYSVAGTTRSLESAQALTQQYPTVFHAHNVFVFDGTKWDASVNNGVALATALADTTHVIVSVPTGRVHGQEDPVLSALGPSLIEILRPTLQWLAYLSTIGVYGETNGVAVDETAPVQSSVSRSQMRIEAERQWLATGLPVHIFRIAGIYGPGRGTLTKVRSGGATRIDLPGRLFNRIHVDDIVGILEASARQPNPGTIYNVSDDEPAPAEQVTAFACELLGVPVVPLQSWEEASVTMSAMAKSFYAESKVVLNDRIKNELGVVLKYPTYREGLVAQFLEEDGLVAFDGPSEVPSTKPYVVLVNIGSLKPEPYLDLRQVGFRLSRALCAPVVTCSFRFSNRIEPSLLHNLPAKTLETVVTEFLQRAIARRGASTATESLSIAILPLFFGPSTTLSEFLPSVLRKVCTTVPIGDAHLSLSAFVGRCLVDPTDNRVAQILHERVQSVLVDEKSSRVSVLVLEHGSPSREVHEATEQVTTQLRALLPEDKAQLVAHACMERREGPEYDFNDPLFEKAVDHYGITSGVVIIALLFFSQGRHAGDKGDIDEIVEGMRVKHPDLEIRVTEPLGPHPLLAEILQDRYRQAIQDSPTYVLP